MISNPLVYQSWLIQSVDMACSMYGTSTACIQANKASTLMSIYL